MPRNITRYISYAVKYGIFIFPVTAFIISTSLFFPFIAGKNFFFRIGVEILLSLWILLSIFDRNYRPRKSPILIAIAVFVFILILATIFGVNPSKSFWSNFERMEGLVTYLHLFAYFLIITSVFKQEKDWKRFFYVMLGVSFIMAIYSMLQLAGKVSIHQGDVRVDGTFGNATYLAIFMIFHIFLMFLIFSRTSKLWLRLLLSVFITLSVLAIFATGTRGAMVGFLGSVGLLSLLLLIFSKKKRARYFSIGVIAIIFALTGVFLAIKNTDFVKKNQILNRVASISFKTSTMESRFTIWGMAIEAFRERPILGYGPGNFNVVFNKYFKPKLFKQEPWFDRAHNIAFDWLIAGGILGFLAYWSIFAAVFYSLWKIIKKQKMKLIEISIIGSLFAAYIFHNFFVFDNIVSYFLFFTILGYVNYNYLKREVAPDGEEIKLESSKQVKPVYYFAAGVSIISIIFSFYFVNVKPMLAGKQLLTTLGNIQQPGQNFELMLGEFDKIFNYQTFGTSEARTQLTGYANRVLASNAPEELKIKVAQKAITEMEQQIKEVPNDARYYIFLGSLYAKIGRFEDALETLNIAQELSPQKQQIRFVIADVYLLIGQNDKAQAILQEAYDLDHEHVEGAKNLAIVAIVNGQEEYAEELLISHFKTPIVADKQLIAAYNQVGNYEKVKEIWKLILEESPNNAQYHVSLAATYSKLGEIENAVRELEKAIELNPQFKEEGEYYINELRAGRTP